MPYPKYALVYWVKSVEWSIVLAKHVLETEMLFNSNVLGYVEEVGTGKIPSKGWPKFIAKVLAVAGTHF